MNKFFLNFLFIIPFCCICAISTYAQSNIRAIATAEVVEALKATELSALNFGKFSPEISGGEIRLTPDGIRTAIGNVSLTGSSYNPAVFQLVGQKETSVNIILPSGTVILTNQSSGKSLEVYNWVVNPGETSGIAVLSNGVLLLKVGATLKVGTISDNPIGKYSGIYEINFSYD